MNISHEEVQYIFSVLEVVVNSDYGKNWIWPETAHKTAMERTKDAITLLQSRLAEPDAGANVEFPTPAYLRVSDNPVDISITDYYTEPQLRSYADARVAASRLAEAEQEHVPVFTTGHCKEKAQKGGCQLHNLQCSYPACDRKLTAQQVAPK